MAMTHLSLCSCDDEDFCGGKMEIESCRDCANFEDRRNIEKVAICAMHHGPSVCCPEFRPRNRKTDAKKLYDSSA